MKRRVDGGRWTEAEGRPEAGTSALCLAVTAVAGVGTGAHADWEAARSKERVMALHGAFNNRSAVRVVIAVTAIAVTTAACTSVNDTLTEVSGDLDGGSGTTSQAVVPPGSENFRTEEGVPDIELVEDGDTLKAMAEDGSIVFQATSPQVFDAKIIRDGRLDVRVKPGAFGTTAEQVRVIAADLGGYVASGETHIEEFDDDRYAVGWYTMRIPSGRFDEAVGRVEQLGERVSASLSSQDVTEEYVDLEGRLNYWRQLEQFYSALMDEAETVSDMIALQAQMQEVLLTIEQIEGRMRYLDSRTDFATLTVGLTEVPGGPVVPPVDPAPSGTIERAFEQAGEVLLATVAFLIVAAAVAIPIGVLALMVYGILRLILAATRRKETTA
jgi:hypothetical protein